MERYICIHAHFYQPARENPWLEAIEVQDSAAPYHDWNERITRECYAPNAAARILDSSGRIHDIVNNYARISFNFGPTLLAWMEKFSPGTYLSILDADRESIKRFGGHGSAIAQAHSHAILPLATARDKETQVYWGIEDFVQRFGRRPEGMWLPETAVDVETLEVLARQGIAYTILAPHQAKKIRKIGETPWTDVSGARIDPSRAYLARLPSGRSINLFFYDGPISRAVAFERLLAAGDHFVGRLTSGFSHERSSAQLMHIATDGETYGHHHSHGDMALAYALDTIEQRGDVKLTNYGQFLELHPPAWEVVIEERTAWSCAHGVGRWEADCGCRTGGEAHWNQAWRRPLRDALDWLRDAVAPFYENAASDLFHDVWQARNDYINVINDRSVTNIDRFLAVLCGRTLTREETVRALQLLELQRYALLMYTSCGWFFNEVSGIETVQVLQYAGRVLQLARDLGADADLEPLFLEHLEKAASNLSDEKNARAVYEKSVRPAVVDLTRVGAHFAISSLFERFPTRTRIYSYEVSKDDYHLYELGRSEVALGRVTVTSIVTRESAVISFGVLYLGEVSVLCGVRTFRGDDHYASMMQQLSVPFVEGDFTTTAKKLEENFGALTYSIRSLFRDEQRKILELIWRSTLGEAETAFRQLYERYVPLVQLHGRLGVPLPKVLQLAAEFAINVQLGRAFDEPELVESHVRSLLQQAQTANVGLDGPTLSFKLARHLERLADRLLEEEDVDAFQRFEHAFDLVRSLPFEVDLWRVQNSVHRLRQHLVPELERAVGEGDTAATAKIDFVRSVARKLQFRDKE